MARLVSNLSEYLFWDTNKEQIDPEIHSRWLIERVLQKGRWEDWLLIRDYYGKSRLKSIRPALRLDDKTDNFLAIYCGL